LKEELSQELDTTFTAAVKVMEERVYNQLSEKLEHDGMKREKLFFTNNIQYRS
jgi:hypothetical protein